MNSMEPGEARQRYGPTARSTEIATHSAVPIPVFVDVLKPDPRHHTPSQLFASALSLGSESKAMSMDRISQTLRPSILTGPGIRPSATSSSNFPAETPTYIAASSRESPRRGTGRTSERVRADILATENPTYRGQSLSAAAEAPGVRKGP